MKVRALLLSITMISSILSSAFISFDSEASTNATTEIREDASNVPGDTESSSTESRKNESSTQVTTTEAVPKVVIPSTESANDPELDTTKGKLKITIEPEKNGWFNETAKLKVKVEKISTKVPRTTIDKVEAKIGASGSWQDITDDMFFEVTENCTVYVKVTDQYKNEYEKSRLIKIFDTIAPTFNAAVNEGLLTVTSYDTESGVECVYINGYKYVPDKHGITTIRLEKFDATYQNFYVYAVDKAGNISNVNTIANPYWTDPNAEKDDSSESTENPADSLPDNATPKTSGEATAEVTAVTDEDGEDITNEIKTKQFYSIVTADGQQYYLVIDMSGAQNKSGEGENAAYTGANPNNGTVYFLTSVSNQNLLNFINDGEETLPHNSIASANGIDPYTMTPVKSDENTTEEEEPEVKEEKRKMHIPWDWILAIGGACLFVIIILVVKGNGRKGKPEASDDSMYDDSDEPETVPLDTLNEEEE